MPVRLKDIARELNVSVVTVSKVLRGHSDIGAETRDRVLAKVREMNYRPNLLARTLVTGRSHTMGLVVPDLVHPFFSEVAKGMAEALRREGYSLLISASEEDGKWEQDELDKLYGRRVDALVLASAQSTADGIRQLDEYQIPYVLIDRQFEGHAANFVGVDDEQVGRLATQHLVKMGCRKIAHIRGLEVSPAIGRLRGYLAALGREAPDEYVVMAEKPDDAGVESGEKAMKQLLQLQPRPDGVFCYNDPLALGAMKASFAAGLDVPNDIKIIGCGNVYTTELLRVPLSSVDQSCREIGKLAAEMAIRLVKQKTAASPEVVLLPPEVKARRSTERL